MSERHRRAQRKALTPSAREDPSLAGQAPAHAEVRRRRLQLAGLAAVVVAAVLAAHWTALSAKALGIDDPEYLSNNPLVQNPSWDSTWRFLSEVSDPSSVKGYYQPLTMISLMLDCAMGGSPENLSVFHRTSLFLHVANTLLVMGLLYLLFRNAWAAGAAALLFGLHPMTVETIPWIGERKTLLAAFFALISLCLYVMHARKGGWKWLALCAAAYILAVMSKPTATLLPAVFLLMDFWPLRRLDGEVLPYRDPTLDGLAVAGVVRRLWPFRADWQGLVRDRRPLPVLWKPSLLVLEKAPLFVIAAASAAVTYVSQSKLAAVHRSVGKSILILCHNIVFYPSKMLWPAGLTSHYEYPGALDPSVPGGALGAAFANPAVLAGVLGTVVLVAVLAISLRWTRAPSTGWVIFLAAIFPAMGVIGFSNVIASDKFAYLPAVGLLMVLAHYLRRLWDWRPATAAAVPRGEGVSPLRREGTSPSQAVVPHGSAVESAPLWLAWPRAAILAAVAALAFAEGVETRRYLAVWQDTISLYRHMLAHAPNSQMIHNNLGRYVELQGYGLLEQSAAQAAAGRSAEAQAASAEANQRLREARLHFEEAVRLAPTFDDALVNLGKAVYWDAQREFNALLQEASTNPEKVPQARTAALRREDALRQAEVMFQKAMVISEGRNYIAASNLGMIAFQIRGDVGAGIQWFQKALAVNPYAADAHLGLGQALEARNAPGDLVEAWRHLLMARAVRPGGRNTEKTLDAFLKSHPEFRSRAPR